MRTDRQGRGAGVVSAADYERRRHGAVGVRYVEAGRIVNKTIQINYPGSDLLDKGITPDGVRACAEIRAVLNHVPLNDDGEPIINDDVQSDLQGILANWFREDLDDQEGSVQSRLRQIGRLETDNPPPIRSYEELKPKLATRFVTGWTGGRPWRPSD